MDIDDELQLLQRELMAVQQEKTNPLSERTVAEIMVKLYHEGFAFIPTTDGNEYITPDKLDSQIAELVRQRGKIGLSTYIVDVGILPQLLNVGQDVVENRLNPLLQKWPITRHVGNLYSQKYFDNLIVGLAQRLQEEGKIDIELVAVENEFKTDFAQRLIKENLQKLNAELSGKQLITREYTLLEKAKILGFLSAINNPLQIDILYKTVDTSAKEAEKLVIELINQGLIKGKLANGYYVPDRFTANQKKIVTQFLDNNGYVDSEMLQKKYLITKPDDWIKKNLGANFVKMERYYVKQQKLESYATQVIALLKSEGFIELSHVLPLHFEDEKSLHQFLDEKCGLKDYFSCEGYVYSNEWLDRLAGEFKHKIIQNIFFKKGDQKGKDAKKKGKKEKAEPLLTEEELQEVLFNGGYAEYSVAETLAPELLDLLTQRLQELRKRTEKQLASSKGLISSSFLKYKFCKTILRTQESLNRTINIIQKQLKKTEKWIDSDFGPNEVDMSGIYGILYYDNIVPKGWPSISIQSLQWKQVKSNQLLSYKQGEMKSFSLKKCMFVPLYELLLYHNNHLKRFSIRLPQLQPLTQQSVVPFVYRFYISEKEARYVIVDNNLPFVDGVPFSSFGALALAEKAYAKLRYCYKGIMNVGIHQMLLELTGIDSLRYNGDTEQVRSGLYEVIAKHLQNQDFIVILGEGQADKKIVIDEKQTELQTLKPYYILGQPQEVTLFPSKIVLPLKTLLEYFRNIFVIEGKPKE